MKGPLVALVAKSSPQAHHGAKAKGKEPAHASEPSSPRSAPRQGFERPSFDRHAADDGASTSSSSSASVSSSRSSSQRSSFTGSLPDDARTGHSAAAVLAPLYLAAAARIDEPLLPPRPPFRTSTGRIVTPDSAYGSMDDVNSLPCPTSTSSSPPSSRCSSASYSSPPSDSGFGSSNAPSPVPSALDVRLLRPSNSARVSSRSSTRTGIILHRQTRSKSVGATAHRQIILPNEQEVEEPKQARRPVLTIDLSEPVPTSEGWEEDEEHHLRIQPHWRLKRRHTTPGLSRRPAVPASAEPTVPRSLIPWRSSPSGGLPPATRFLVTGSLALTVLAFASPSLPLSPTSWLRHVPWPPTPTAPIYLLEARHSAWSAEWLNALLNAPLLVLDPAAVQTRHAGETFAVGALVALARFGLLAVAEAGLAPRRRTDGWAFVGLLAALWAATVVVRVGAGYGLGRLTGWQWPGLFFGGAVHEWSLGIGPLLWALLPFQAMAAFRPSMTAPPCSPSMRRNRRKISWSTPAPARRHHRAPLTAIAASRRRLDVASVARKGGAVAPAVANLLLTFLAPHPELWWCLSGLVAGSILALFASVALSRSRPSLSLSNYRLVIVRMAVAAVALAIVSALRDARVGSGPSVVDVGTSSDGAMYALYPTQSKVLTVLLMTAPRPGHPDFLIRTLSTYLSSFPDPSANPLAGSRLSLVVYTHFADHPVFEHARDVVFAQDPKAMHYVTWVQQQPRDGDRLDQRLHLARALGLVSRGERPEDVPAYVLLAEDDFPLCPDQALSPLSYAGSPLALLKAGDEVEKPTYAASWSTLSRLMLAANAKMPDLATDPRPESGHCGVWVGTGGSGLIMRGWLADRLPGLLLGDDDVDGQRRERQGLTPDQVASEAPPTDVLIQDCLLGKLPGCEACAAPDLSSSRSTSKADGRLVDSEPFKRSPALAALRRAYLALSAGDRPREPTVSARRPGVAPGDRWGKSGLVTSERLLMRHLGYNASTIPGRSYKREEWDCGWRHPFNGDPDVLTL